MLEGERSHVYNTSVYYYYYYYTGSNTSLWQGFWEDVRSRSFAPFALEKCARVKGAPSLFYT